MDNTWKAMLGQQAPRCKKQGCQNHQGGRSGLCKSCDNARQRVWAAKSKNRKKLA